MQKTKRDGQEIKISIRMKKFHFIKDENKLLKNSDVCAHGLMTLFKFSERSNKYS